MDINRVEEVLKTRYDIPLFNQKQSDVKQETNPLIEFVTEIAHYITFDCRALHIFEQYNEWALNTKNPRFSSKTFTRHFEEAWYAVFKVELTHYRTNLGLKLKAPANYGADLRPKNIIMEEE